MRSPYNIGPMTPQKLGLLSAAIPSPAGDVVGLLADAWGYAKEPESLTPMNGLLSVAGVLPLVPGQLAKIKPIAFDGKEVSKAVDVIANPKVSDISRLWGKKPIRWLRSKEGDLYFWEAADIHHEPVAKSLNKMGAEFKPTEGKHGLLQYPLPGQSDEPVSGFATFGRGGFMLTDQNNKSFKLKDLMGAPYKDVQP